MAVSSRTALALQSATTRVSVHAATAPSSGQVLTATAGTTATWQTPAAGGGSVSLYQNALINGGFDIWQRATTFTFNDDTFGPDRWNLLTETNGAWTVARDTDVPAALGFKYSAKCINVTLNNQMALVYLMENVDAMKLDDQAVSLSFYAKTSGTEIANLRATVLSWSSTADAVTSDVIGTWAQDGTDPTWATNWTAEVAGANKTLTSSWQRFTVENVTIDTASMANIAVVIWVDDGTIAANDDFWVTGVMLNQGATALTWNPKSYNQELLDCRRYFYRPGFDTQNAYYVYSLGAAITATTGRAMMYFPVHMRIGPTLSTSTISLLGLTDDAGSGLIVLTALATGISGSDHASLNYTVASGLTAFRQYIFLNNNSASGYIDFSAEL